MREPEHHEAIAQNRSQLQPEHDTPRTQSRIPSDSIVFTKLVPVALVIMGLITTVLILAAIGVLMGFIPFR